MSVKVDLDELASALEDFSFAYLITVGEDHRAHTIAVQPALADGVFDVGTQGATTSRNVESRPNVTLVWPPSAAGGYSLIVDDTASIDGSLKVTPGRAVLHRRAADMPESPTGRAHDCVPLKKP